MDRKLILLPAAIMVGLAGGYAWSVTSAPKPREAASPKATTVDAPPSPEELPEESDHEWASRSNDGPQPISGSTLTGGGVYYSGCNEVRAAGKAPLHQGDPSYRPEMDGDGDGIACEPFHPRH
jgi:hypothetical protein